MSHRIVQDSVVVRVGIASVANAIAVSVLLSRVGDIHAVIGATTRIATSQIVVGPSVKIFVHRTMETVTCPSHLTFASKSKIDSNPDMSVK